MKYYQSDKKPLNYFERQKRRQQLKKYRYYFFDYMYYCGEKWSEKGGENQWIACILSVLGILHRAAVKHFPPYGVIVK